MPSASRVIQVTNVAPAATREQMKTLFGFLGRIDDLVIYPELETASMPTKICFVKFSESDDVGVALHLTNTVFIDRALIVVPVPDGKIPDEKTALSSPTSQYPVLPASTELSKVDEIRRTVYVANVDAAVNPETLMQFFGVHAGEVKFARMAGDDIGVLARAAFIEFTEQVSVVRALALSGQLLGSRPIMVVPANTAIVKPGVPSASSRDISEAMRKVEDAQPLIEAAVDADANGRRSSRSKSRSRHRRSRSRSHGSRSTRRSRSHRSRSRHRSGSRSHRSRRRSSSKSPRLKTPPSPPKRRRSRSKSRDRKRPKSRSASPKPSRSARRSRSPGRRDRRDGDKRSRSRSPPKFGREGSGFPDRDSRRHGRDDSSRGRRDGSRRSPMRAIRKSRSKSRSPGSHGLKKDKSRHSESSRDKGMDRRRESDGKRERDLSSRQDSRRESSDRKDRSDRKSSSSKHRRDKESDRKPKPSKAVHDSEEEEEPEEEEEEKSPQRRDEGSEEDDGGANEEDERQSAASEENHSENESQSQHGKSPTDANLSRLDMDVDSE